MFSAIAIHTVGRTPRFGAVPAPDSVDLNMVEDGVFGYLDPNGTGTSTTPRLLAGLLRPTAGAAHVFDLNAWSSAPAVHRLIGDVPSQLALYDVVRSP
ncbi:MULTISPECIES: hypothetical protein [unclassified Rhodococcus (in: high G+C Gram-positive bacteria)]|uniref:hypothetical protein n=1 Tax=unclassified Rhodococcus (in: high G+C Gram-positive bacteria) TaxID=192944 RepID=UPI00030E7C0D|nr:hypothetical protein [Rhodococcus sp. DK17]